MSIFCPLINKECVGRTCIAFDSTVYTWSVTDKRNNKTEVYHWNPHKERHESTEFMKEVYKEYLEFYTVTPIYTNRCNYFKKEMS